MDNLQSLIAKLRKEERERSRWIMIAMTLSLLVFIGVSWHLAVPVLTVTQEVSCGYEEHMHSESCYDEVLTCPQEENEDHTHGELCYELILCCEMEEHVHERICYSDSEADVESVSDWENTVPAGDDLTGSWAEDLAAVAVSQLGYQESTRNFEIDDEEERGYTRYGRWYGDPYEEWNTLFVSFCLYYAEIPGYEIPQTDNAVSLMQELSADGLYQTEIDSSLQVGDLVFYVEGGTEKTRVGIVETVEKEDVDGEEVLTAVTIIEGDLEDTVARSFFYINDGKLSGYVDIVLLQNGEEVEYDTDEITEDTVVEETEEIVGDENSADVQDAWGIEEVSEEENEEIADVGIQANSFMVKKTWEEDMETEPVSVRLLCDGVEVEREDGTVTLSDENEWTYTWRNLPDNGTYTAEEIVPEDAAYTVDYTRMVTGGSGVYGNRERYEDTSTVYRVNRKEDRQYIQRDSAADSVTEAGWSLCINPSRRSPDPTAVYHKITNAAKEDVINYATGSITDDQYWQLLRVLYLYERDYSGREYIWYGSLQGVINNIIEPDGYSYAESDYYWGIFHDARYDTSLDDAVQNLMSIDVYVYVGGGIDSNCQNTITVHIDDGSYLEIHNKPRTDDFDEAEIRLVKVDGNDESPLSGAVFELYKQTEEGLEFTGQFGTTDSSGQLVFGGISVGEYYLVETKAPEGYSILTDKIYLTVDDTGVSASDSRDTVILDSVYTGRIIQVSNYKEEVYEVILPETGGTGIERVTRVGISLVMTAAGTAWFNYMSRRKRSYK